MSTSSTKQKSGIKLTIVLVVILFLLVFIITRMNKKQESLGATSKKKISQHKCKKAFEILEQIQSALNDKKERLSIAETAWFKAINEL